MTGGSIGSARVDEVEVTPRGKEESFGSTSFSVLRIVRYAPILTASSRNLSCLLHVRLNIESLPLSFVGLIVAALVFQLSRWQRDRVHRSACESAHSTPSSVFSPATSEIIFLQEQSSVLLQRRNTGAADRQSKRSPKLPTVVFRLPRKPPCEENVLPRYTSLAH